MLDLHNIYKTFNAGTVNEKTALNGLNLHLNEGDFVTVIGGNGAGKRRKVMHRKIEETPEREKMLIRLKELRLERGYSMTQAARKIFSHPDTYNRYEKGIREIPLDCLITLAKLYDCSLDYLAGVSDQPRKYGR